MLKKIEQKTTTLHSTHIERGDLYDADKSDSNDNPADENGGRNALETGSSV